MLSRMSLRARLVLGVMLLAALGLAAADVATYASLRSFLLHRTDSSLDAAHVGVVQSFLGPQGGKSHGGPEAFTGGTPIAFVQIRKLDNTIVASRTIRQFPDEGDTEAPPLLPKTIKIPPGSGEHAVYFTAPARTGDGRYQVRASTDPSTPNFITIAATLLTGVDSTLHRLLLIELLVTLVVLGAMTALGLWVVRISLHPLDAIGKTAAAIANGDLTRRVERAESRTEVGRLGLALNGMLHQIETAFNAREASEQRLRRFVADASHELRTPLAAVRAYAELFKRGADRNPEDLARTMSGITRESERMSLLVDDLLLLARLDEGRPLERKPVDLEQVVAEAVETAHAVDPARPIQLDAERTVVLGDRERLRQIVDNLLSNVRAHTPPQAPVHVHVGSTNGSGVIEVQDSGPGMEAAQAERVFERFYRADPSRSRANAGGVGLGLSIVAAVAKAHGGTVSAESEPGAGSTFRISLPLAPNSG
jgi:two-component system OmpR family sensor kinase